MELHSGSAFPGNEKTLHIVSQSEFRFARIGPYHQIGGWTNWQKGGYTDERLNNIQIWRRS